ncbi:MAG: hypothetical protein HY744_23990 [Deltaproteobacteria bacterium]|nr:hypothetical protein [Deltaproteobacteria bacterium]
MIRTYPCACAALAGALLVLSAGRAAQADAIVALPSSGVELQLPGSPGDWRAREEGGGDRVERTSPPSAALSMQFHPQPGATDECIQALFKIHMQFLGSAELVDAPPYVPPGYEPRAVEVKLGGERGATACAKRPQGGLLMVALAGADWGAAAPIFRQALAQYLGAGGAVGAGAGELVLPVSKMKLKISGPDEWRAKESQGDDFIYRTRAPLISFKLLSRSESNCDDVLAGLSTGGRPARTAVSPRYLPDRFHRIVTQVEPGPPYQTYTCVKRAAGQTIIVSVLSDVAQSDPAIEAARPVLEAIAQAVGAQVTRPPAPPGGGTKKLTLPVTGVTIAVASAWRVKLLDEEREEGADQLQRVDPSRPPLAIWVKPDPGDCESWERAGRQDAASGFAFVMRPAYLPPGWHPAVAAKQREGTHVLSPCVNLERGKLRVMVIYGGSLADPDLSVEAKNILAQIAFEAGAKVPKPGPVRPPPVSPRSPPPPGPSPAVPAEPPAEEEEEEDAGPWKPYWLTFGLDASVFQLAPDEAGLPKSVGGAARPWIYAQLLLAPHLSLGGELMGEVGYNGDGNLLGDATLGARLNLFVSALTVSALGGGGWDTISGADGTVYEVPGAFYGRFGGRLHFDWFRYLGLLGRVDHLIRAEDRVPSETRVGVGVTLWVGGPVGFDLLFRYTHYADAEAMGGTLGASF